MKKGSAMKTLHTILAAAVCFSLFGSVRGGDAIYLPEPVMSGGVSLLDALAERQSSRDFADANLSAAQLSDLLWAVAGVNRSDGRKVYAVSMNRHDMTVFVIVGEGTYRYDPEANALVPVAPGDHRAKAGTQPFVAAAAVNLVYVQDMGLWKDSPGQAGRGRDWGFAHAGEMAQNAYLYAAGKGWSAVVRGLFDQAVLKDLLGLADDQHVRLVQSVGPKE